MVFDVEAETVNFDTDTQLNVVYFNGRDQLIFAKSYIFKDVGTKTF